MKVFAVTIHGKLRYRVDCGRIEGKRKQRTFGHIDDARLFLRSAETEKEQAGIRGLKTFLSITEIERQDIVEAKRIKDTTGLKASWQEIMGFYLKNATPKLVKVKLKVAVSDFLAAKSGQTKPRKLSARYIKELTYQLEAFEEGYTTHSIGDFTKDVIGEYLNDFENSYTFNNQRIALSMLFDFAIEKEWIW